MKKIKALFAFILAVAKPQVVHGSAKHKTGNVIAGLANIADGIITIVSLGNIAPHTALLWAVRRLKKGVLYDNYTRSRSDYSRSPQQSQ
jgi:hypothetical protein